jgi:LCP family protein required for cell wall assembly
MWKRIITILVLVASAISIALGIYSAIIPTLYMGLFIVGYLIVDGGIIFLITRKKKLLVGISILLTIIVIVVSMIMSFLFIRSAQIIGNITHVDDEICDYAVVVLKSSKYKKLKEIKDKDVGVIENFDGDYKKAINNLEDKVDINTKEYDNALMLANNLLSKDIEVIFLDENYISILDEGINGFEDKIRILDVIEIKNKKTNQTFKEIDMDNDSFNIYISGIDTYGSINTVSRSDVNIIATVNPKTSKILLTSIPRDMYVPLAGKDGLNDKLTHAGVYGIDTSIKTIENFLDIDIDYYVRINFNSLISLVDYLGGIDVYSDYEFRSGDRTYTKGLNKNLNGEEALAFSRNRYSFVDGDRQRGRNQEKVIEAIINKVTVSKDINTYLNLLSTLEKSFQTNMSKDNINEIISKQIENNYKWDITSADINGSDYMDYTYSYPWQKLYVMIVNEDSLNSAKERINRILN